MKQALKILYSLRNFLVLLAVIAVFGYTLQLLSQVVNATPDQAYLDKQKKTTTTKIDTKSIDAVQKLQPVAIPTLPEGSGKSDPFTQ